MAPRPLATVLQQLRYLAGAPRSECAPDRHLLDQFAGGGDEAAFAGLMQRHGPLVLSVCRRLLGNRPEVEDAFQATFLVLARKAGSIRHKESIASWLYQVANRIALRARAAEARQRAHERQAPSMSASHRPQSRDEQRPEGVDALQEAPDRDAVEPEDVAVGREARLLLDEELQRLPEKYRAPLVLCYLQGKTNEEAARELGWPSGSMSSRLTQARERLRQRLTSRGLALSTGLLGTVLLENSARAALPGSLLDTTVKAALLFAAREAAAAEVASTKAIVLAQEMLSRMALTRWKTAAAALLTACILGGGGWIAYLAASPALPSRSNPSAVWQVRTTLDHPDKVQVVALAPDGRTLAVGTANGVVKLWDLASRREQAVLPAHAAGVQCLAFSPDGRLLAVAAEGKEGQITVWDVAQRNKRATFQHRLPVCSLGFAPDFADLNQPDPKPRLISADRTGDGSVRVWDVDAGRSLSALAYSAYLLTPDRKALLIWNRHGDVLLNNLAGQGPEVRLHERLKANTVSALGFSADGQLLATSTASGAGGPCVVKLWELASGKQRLAIGGLQAPIVCLALSSDGKLLATAGKEPTVKLWDTAKGKEHATLRGHTGTISTLAFTPSDGTLITGSHDQTVKLWQRSQLDN